MRCSEELCGWCDAVPGDAKMFAHAWWCGDDYCNCTQARIDTYTERIGNIFRGYNKRKNMWQGPFNTDCEGNPSHDINRMARHLRKYHHDLYKRIVWPWEYNQKPKERTSG